MAESTGTYTVLARRYRPQTFDAVVGQQHVAQALRNAIRGERVAHAYLFTGARGVGKTSMARILAKALNCRNAVDGNPCNQCDLCQAISTGSDVDVLEIDGASNRGIDDIRSLRANVGIRSMRTRVKMYIIDEVHMLTKEAFNALLKTLEEPPPNVKFVFCTTEPHKVPDTILSRCQRFDFSSIETQKIAERLAEIAAQEGIVVASEAVDLVARRAGGSMRDSQSLFDQLLAFGGERIEARDVNQLLGTADDERLLKMIRLAQQKQQAELIAEVDSALRDGVQLGNLLDQLVNCYRDLMIVRCGATQVELIGVGPALREELIAVSQQLGLSTITAAMQILSEAKTKLSRVSHGRALIDLALIRISLLEELDDLSQLISDLKQGDFAAIAPQVSRTTTTRPAASTASAPMKTVPAGAASGSGSATGTGKATGPSEGVSSTSASPSAASVSAPAAAAEPVNSAGRPADSAGASPQKKSDESVREPLSSLNEEEDAPSFEEIRAAIEAPPAAAEQPAPGTAAVAKATVKRVEFVAGNDRTLWQAVLETLDEHVLTHVKNVREAAISAPNRLDIFFPANYSFSKSYLEERSDLVRRLEAKLRELTGLGVQVRFQLDQAKEGTAPKSVAAPMPGLAGKVNADHAFIQAAEAIFSATISRSERMRRPS